MKKHTLLSLSLLLALLALPAAAEEKDAPRAIKLGDGISLRYGADVRARWETFDRAVTNPDIASHTHPATQYLRVRTRAWLALDLEDSFTVNLRLNNRIHHVSSSPSDPNNRDSATWEAPDEVILDLANVVWHTDWSGDNGSAEHFEITLGRQGVSFGNGMIFSDSTPFDQGRSNYNDGLMLRYKYLLPPSKAFPQNSILFDAALFSFYEDWKDDAVFINDRNRRLRSANIFTAGAYVTFGLKDTLTLDVYSILSKLDDTHPREAERNFFADCSGRIHTNGLRLFARPVKLLDVSLEGANQNQQLAHSGDMNAYMVDARLNVHLDDYLPAAPTAGLEYTCFSGDKQGTRKHEGWFPIYSQSPLWGDELIPIMLNGNWTNLQITRAYVAVKPLPEIKLLAAASHLLSDEDHGYLQSNTGRDFGDLLSGSAEYEFNKSLSFLCQVSYFIPGDYFANGHNSFWTRLQVMYKF